MGSGYPKEIDDAINKEDSVDITTERTNEFATANDVQKYDKSGLQNDSSDSLVHTLEVLSPHFSGRHVDRVCWYT